MRNMLGLVGCLAFTVAVASGCENGSTRTLDTGDADAGPVLGDGAVPPNDGGPGGSTSASCSHAVCKGLVTLTVGARRCALYESGRVRCAPDPDLAVSPDSTADLDVKLLDDAQQLVSGTWHQCALRKNGKVVCWGSNSFCALGVSKEELPSSLTPVEVAGLSEIETLVSRDSFYQMDLTCAQDRAGKVWCWGVKISCEKPTEVPELAGATHLAVSDQYICGVVEDKRVVCVGPEGAVHVHQSATLAAPVKLLSAGWYHFCALTADGVSCHGLGAGGVVEATGFGTVRQLASTIDATCAREASGRVACVSLEHPQAVALPELKGSVLLSSSSSEVCGVAADGTIRCVFIDKQLR